MHKEADGIYFVMEVLNMNGNDIEQAVEILKEKIPLNMKNHVKKIKTKKYLILVQKKK